MERKFPLHISFCFHDQGLAKKYKIIYYKFNESFKGGIT